MISLLRGLLDGDRGLLAVVVTDDDIVGRGPLGDLRDELLQRQKDVVRVALLAAVFLHELADG